MTLQWRDPLHLNRSRVLDRETLAALRSNPGEYAVVGRYVGKGAWNVAGRLDRPADIILTAGWEDQSRQYSLLHAKAVSR